MSNEKQFSQDLLEQILNLVESVINRMAEVGSADDLVLTEQDKLLLDAVCMQYLALGETIKQLDKHTQGELLTRHPNQDWKGIMGFVMYLPINILVLIPLKFCGSAAKPCRNCDLKSC